MVYFTSGDAGSCDRYFQHSCGPAEALNFGAIRMQEARAAMGHLGVPPENILFLGLPDGGSGKIWYDHLHASDPYLAVLLASDHAPYEGLFRPNLPFARDDVVEATEEIIKKFQPDVIFTVHPPAEGHIDHIVNNFFVVKALQELLRAGAISPDMEVRVDRIFDPKEHPATPYHYEDHEFYVSGEAMALAQEAGWFYQSQGGDSGRREFAHLGSTPAQRRLPQGVRLEGARRLERERVKDGNTERVGKEIQPKDERTRGGLINPQAETVDSPAAVAEFPSEPFQCPACGQLLAPACRVCVACKHTIDPAEIARPQEVALPAVSTGPKRGAGALPLADFLCLLGISFFLALSFEGLLGRTEGAVGNGGRARLLPASGCFSMRSGSAFRGRCDGHWARCCCPWSSSPGTWPAEKATIARAVCRSGGGARHSVPAFCLAGIFPGEFDFLYREEPAEYHSANSRAQEPQDRRRYPGQEL